jgi:fatty-acyl-CoA synthase
MLSPEEELAASRRLHWMSVLELHALSRGDKEALVDEDRRLNWRQVRDGVHAVAAELQSRGIGRGDRVFIHSFNNVQYVIALVAINAIGAIACPFNIRAAPAELDYLIPDSGAQLGFADDAGAQTLARSEMGQTVPLIRFGEEFADIVESRAEDDLPGAAEDDLPDLAESDTAFIIYTSGTTSAPKGAMLTHLNMISQTINTNRFAPPGGPDDCSMVVVPLFHIAGLGFVYPALLNGVKTVIAPPKVLAHTDALLDLLEVRTRDQPLPRPHSVAGAVHDSGHRGARPQAQRPHLGCVPSQPGDPAADGRHVPERAHQRRLRADRDVADHLLPAW